MEIFVRDAGNKSVKWRSLLVNVNVCLLTSHPIPERHFQFRAFERGFFGCMKTPNSTGLFQN